MKNENLIWEDLGIKNLKLLQDKNGYRFTSDAVILANFVSAKPEDSLIEFCFGSGIISTLIAYKEKPKEIFGFEIQKNVFERAKESILINQLENVISVFNDDNKNFKKYVNKQVDIVVCNPPYQKAGSGKISKLEEIALSKSELTTNLEEIVVLAKDSLKEKGNFYICFPPQRLAELFVVLKKNSLEPKEMFFSYPSLESAPSCVFVLAKKGAKEGLKVLPPLVTHNDKGDYVAVIQKLFKKQ